VTEAGQYRPRVIRPAMVLSYAALHVCPTMSPGSAGGGRPTLFIVSPRRFVADFKTDAPAVSVGLRRANNAAQAPVGTGREKCGCNSTPPACWPSERPARLRPCRVPRRGSEQALDRRAGRMNHLLFFGQKWMEIQVRCTRSNVLQMRGKTGRGKGKSELVKGTFSQGIGAWGSQ